MQHTGFFGRPGARQEQAHRGVRKQQFLSLVLLLSMLAGILTACGGTDATATSVPVSIATAAPPTSTTAAALPTDTTQAMAATPTTAAASTPTAAPSVAAVATSPTAVPTVPQPPGSTKLTFWYGLTGANGAIVQQVVNRFNSSQTKFYVEAIQQPNYDDTINKLNTSFAGGTLPNIVQIYDIGTQRMIDSHRIVPVQDFIDKEKTDWINDIEPAVASYYTVNGKLYSMPFNSSAPVLYYDKNAFKEVGLDPGKPPQTYDDIFAAAQKLVKKDSSGKITRSGIDFTLYGWIFEQELATQGVTYADPNNGRDGRATKLVFNSPQGENWFNFLKKLVDAGVGRSVGRASGTTNGTTLGANFATGKAAMTIESIATLRGWAGQAAKAGSNVDVGVGYLPKPAGAAGGVIIGGASFWITDQGSADQQQGAWEFIKFAASPEIQAFFASNTGYYPMRRAAYDQQAMKDALTKYPQFQVAIDELRATQASKATAGAVFGTFVGTRVQVEGALEDFLLGKYSSAKDALNSAANKANDNLAEYNSVAAAGTPVAPPTVVPLTIPPTTAPAGAPSGSSTTTTSMTGGSGTITVYTALEDDQLARYLPVFQAAHPDIKLNMVRDSTGIVTAKLLAEKDNPQADVVWGLAATSLLVADKQGMLEPYAPAGVDRVNATFRDAANPPHWVGIDVWESAFCVNTVELKNKNLPMPTSWADLAKPAYKGFIVAPDPNASGTGFLSVAGLLQLKGTDAGWKYLDSLDQNIAQYVPSGSKPCKMAGQGEFPIGISFGYRALQEKQAGSPVEAVWPSEGSGWDLEANALIKKPASNPAAKTFLDWALTDPIVKEYAKSYPITSIPSGVPIPDGYVADPLKQLIKYDLVQAASNRDGILQEWSKRYSSKAATPVP